MRLFLIIAALILLSESCPARATVEPASDPRPDASTALARQLREVAEIRDFDQLIQQADAMEAQVRERGTPGDLAMLLAIRALARAETGRHEAAETEARSALELAEKSGADEAALRAHKALGSNAYRQGRHEIALAEFFQARVLAEAIQQPRLTASILINIGITLRAMGEAARALDYYNLAEGALGGAEDRFLSGAMASNRSRALLDLGRLAEARTQIESAVEQFRLTGDRRGEARSLRTLATMQIASAQLEPVAELVERALAIDSASSSALGVAGDRLVRGQLLAAQGKFAQARSDIDFAIEAARGLNNPGVERDALLAGAELEASAGDHRRAYGLLRDARRLDEQLRSESLRSHALDIESRYRFDQQGATIQTLQKDTVAAQSERDRRAHERNLAVAAALGFLLVAALSLALARERARASASLRETARLDPLTGLGNRRMVFDAVGALSRQQAEAGLTVLAIDVDQFKSINDRFGHAIGDRALCLVADVLRAHSRGGTDIGARWGGEEFLLLLLSGDLNIALQRAEAIRSSVKQAVIDHPLGAVRLSVTIGVAQGAVSQFEKVLASADAAMYQGKREGRNRVETGPVSESP